MALLTSITQTFTTYMTPQKALSRRLLTPPPSEEPQFDGSPKQYLADRDVPTNSGDSCDAQGLDGSTLVEWPKGHLKYSATTKLRGSAKRRRPESTADDLDDFSALEGTTLLESTPPPKRSKTRAETSKNALDRALMPPPSNRKLDIQNYTPAKEIIDGDLSHHIVRQDQEIIDTSEEEDERFTHKTAIGKNDRREIVDFDQQKARRYAKALELPANSGVWAEAEKDLFFRLAFRGFEPLVPRNWTIDFKTLPESLFYGGGSQLNALIVPHLEGEFHAIHALRSLFNLGALVRARSLSCHKSRPEPIIRRIIRRYISWALADFGLHPQQRPRAIPVHAIVSQKQNKTTQATLARLGKKLQKLAKRYRDRYEVRESIEPREFFPVLGVEGTKVIDEDDNMPILTGLMICSSIVAVVTFDSRTPSLSGLAASGIASLRSTPSKPSRKSLQPTHEEQGLRFIGTFDFSNYKIDVWNALAIAICVMRIRKTMLQVCQSGEAAGEAEKGGLWESKSQPRGISADPDT